MPTIKEKLCLFYMGKYCPIMVAVLIFLGHITGLEIPFGIVMALALIPAFFICTDLRFAILPFLCTIFIVSVKDYTPGNPGYLERYLNLPTVLSLSVALALVVASATVFVIRNRKVANSFPKTGLFWGLLIFCATLCCNGIFSSAYVFPNFLFALGFGGVLIGVYLLFAFFLRFDQKSFDYFMYCLVIAGLLIAAELIYAYFHTVQFDANGDVIKGSVVLGWGVWTNIGGMLAMLMPACFYFAYAHKKGWIGFLLGLFELLCILLSQSRGALLVGGIAFLLSLTIICVKGPNRKRNRIYALAIAALGLVMGIFLAPKILSLIQNFRELGFSDNGRFEIWEIGWKHFLDNPFFGSGFYDSYQNAEWDMVGFPYLYHSTVVQVLGAGGAVCALAYVYHRYTTVKQVLQDPNPTKTFLAISVLALLLFSLTDVLLFKIYPTIYYAFLLLWIEKSGKNT